MSASVAYAELGTVARPSLSAEDVNLLRYAGALINAGWCKGALGKAEINGRKIDIATGIDVQSIDCERYSLCGALYRATRHKTLSDYTRLASYLESRLPHDRTSLDHMNDHPAMTKRELLDWLEVCILFAGL